MHLHIFLIDISKTEKSMGTATFCMAEHFRTIESRRRIVLLQRPQRAAPDRSFFSSQVFGR